MRFLLSTVSVIFRSLGRKYCMMSLRMKEWYAKSTSKYRSLATFNVWSDTFVDLVLPQSGLLLVRAMDRPVVYPCGR